ncbi:MAG TPA: hypothetical protein ENI87_10755 [bacterium]|nr:hypothetical protein [bacterium]
MIHHLLALLAAGVPHGPTGTFHAVAFVNDPLSHGTVGDAFLSLNEAIQLQAGTLQLAQLSAAEQIQVSLLPGTGPNTDITWIDVDSEVVATITIQQDLDPISNTPFGLLLRGSGGEVTLDFSGANLTHGIRSTSNGIIVEGFRFVGGPYGIDADLADASGQTGCTVIDCTFENQAQFGVRATGTQANGVGRLILQNCRFDNVAAPVLVDESPAGRNTIFEAHDVRITGATDAFDLAIGTGGTARFTFDRVRIQCTGTGIDLLAPATNGRPTLVEGLHTRIRAATCARIDAASDAVTWLQCSMWNLLASPGGTSLELGAPGAQVYGDLNELRSEGDLTITTGAAPLPLTIRNLRARNGNVTLSTEPTQALLVTESRLTDCVTATAGTGVVDLDGSCFDGGTVGATGPNGLLAATGCYLSSAGPGVTVSQPLPQPQLGAMTVSPDDVPFGGSIQFQADLPAGLVCAFALGTVPSTLPALPPPFYVYLDLNEFVFLPGVYVGQQSATWTVPAQPAFFGADLVVQAAVLPVGPLQAPPLQLPPGWLFTVQ